MKTCKQCKILKPLTEFYKHKFGKDGYLNKCKKCVSATVTANREKNIERIRAYDRARGCRQSLSYFQERRKRCPNQYRAHTMVNNALRDNKLVKKLCSECGSNNRIHAHHDNYLEPLNIRWLCACCHKQWHRDNGEGLNP